MKKLISLYLTSIISIVSVIAVLLTYFTNYFEYNKLGYLIIIVLFLFTFVFSLITMYLNKESDPYPVVLSIIHEIVFNLKSAVAVNKNDDPRFYESLNNILQKTSEAYSLITNKPCNVSLHLVSSREEDITVFRFVPGEKGTEYSLSKSNLKNNIAFQSILSGDRYFYSNDISESLSQKYSYFQDGRNFIRSSIIFPISTIFLRYDKNRIINERIVQGFLSIDSEIPYAFIKHNPKKLEEDLIYRVGSIVSDNFSLIFSLFEERIIKNKYRI